LRSHPGKITRSRVSFYLARPAAAAATFGQRIKFVQTEIIVAFVRLTGVSVLRRAPNQFLFEQKAQPVCSARDLTGFASWEIVSILTAPV
jgi:hypothetical protein